MRSFHNALAAAATIAALLIPVAAHAEQGSSGRWGLFAGGAVSGMRAQVAEISPARDPKEAVESLHGVLLAVMQRARQLGFDGRRSQIQDVVLHSFNIPAMARTAAGKYWKNLDRDTRSRLVEAFARMTIATYADRFKGYNGEKFVMIGDKPGPRGTRFVQTQIIKGSGESVRIDYLTRSYKGQWKIIDIFLKGSISELATKRSEYTAVIKSRGVEELLREIDSKIANMR